MPSSSNRWSIGQYTHTIISIALIVPAGFYSKFYSGPASNWVNNYFGGILYVVFWCLVVFICTKLRRPWRVAAGVFLATSILEILQLWHPLFLETIRSTFIGATLLGTTFAWLDFPHYAAGSIIAGFWMAFIGARKNETSHTNCLR